ncbi:unnamed protein product [Lactuca virosa]|uniref:Protein kinase domain-containing protein n=1 Tax=Lactuca virosa TaxID=75947 RepID=A0AAU9PNT9_9ASTR|nr:unnamed protein product [Lactuca virosa]
MSILQKPDDIRILQKPDDIRILQKLDQFRIPFEDIKQATNNFGPENVIGLGGYGMVYMGELIHKHSRTPIKIAAKRVDRRFNHGVTHFLNEIKVLSSYKHVNIVSFIGFCDEHDEKILVEKFVAYGSLDNYLSSAKLNWMNRIQICLGAAHGLNYLHNGLEGHSVLHRDIRSRTILLDTNWQPKIGGLGLSMMDPMLQIISDGFGANGYVDPMFLKTGIITKESDVYSFGVVLFEVLCGRLVYETSEDEKQFLGPLACERYEEGKLNEIIDPILREQMNLDSLEAFSAIAYQCVANSRWQRPSMIQIVQKLEQVLRLQQEFENALALQQVAQSLKGKPEDEDCYKVKNLEHMKIPLEQIKLATRDFHDDFLIGRGGYGKVYKADLFHFDVQKYIKENNKIIEILDPKLKKEFEKGSSSTFDDEICPDSVVIFAIIAYKCLQENRDDRPSMPEVVEELEKALKSHVKGVERLRTSLDAIRFATNDFSDVTEQGVHHTVLEERPTMAEVVKELEKAFECQDEWEWEQKLPRDYEKIIHVSNYLVSNISSKKDLHSLLSSGILIPNEKLWFSISMDGVKNVVISATKFSYKNVKWRSIRKSRFAKVAKIPDLSNLNIRINIKTQFLTPGVMYRAYLVFKFCDRRKSGKLEAIGLQLNCIEFQAIHHVDTNSNEELNYERNIGPLKPMSNMDLVEQMTIDYCQEIINRSENNIRSSSKEELHNLLFKGILIDKGEKIFSLSKENRKKCHMLPAKAVIYDHSDVKSYKIKLEAQFRFGEYVEILSCHELHIKCDIETQMLSSDTAYACFLVFKLSENCGGLKCPVKARDLLPYKKERTKIISFRSPNIVDLDKIKWIPKQREDGWMEVIVWETISDDSDSIPMDLKLISFEGTMAGLMVCGIEFRPI